MIGRDRDEATAGARAALAAVREPWEPESTAYNLSLIREARAARGGDGRVGRRARGRAAAGRRGLSSRADGRRATSRGDHRAAARPVPRSPQSPRSSAATGRIGPIAPMLAAVARRALYEDWEPNGGSRWPRLLRDHQQFGYARRLLGRVRAARRRQRGAAPAVRALHLQGHGAPAARRLDRALRSSPRAARSRTAAAPRRSGSRGRSTSTSGTGDAKRADLESAEWCYGRGYEQRADPNHAYAGLTRPSSATSWRSSRSGGPGSPSEAAALRERADEIRRRDRRRRRHGDERLGGDATLGEALFGLGRFEEAAEHLARVPGGAGEESCGGWRRRRCSSARSRGCAASTRRRAAAALEALVGGRRRRPFSAPPPARSGWRSPAAASAPRCFTSACSPGWRSAGCCAGSRCSRASPAARSSAPTTTSKLRRLLESKADAEIEDADYVTLVRELADGVPRRRSRGNLRGRLFANVGRQLEDARRRATRAPTAPASCSSACSSPDPATGERDGEWRMTDLIRRPRGREDGFSLRYENWLREARCRSWSSTRRR